MLFTELRFDRSRLAWSNSARAATRRDRPPPAATHTTPHSSPRYDYAPGMYAHEDQSMSVANGAITSPV